MRGTLLAPVIVFLIIGGNKALQTPHQQTSQHKIKKRSIENVQYETRFLTQKLDHFSFGSNATFEQRYLIAKQHWTRGGPIFFYAGNEGNIEWFCNNTGFMWDIAPEFHAMIVFGEHRYYGESQPFGNETFKEPSNLKYLTAEQALADFAVLLQYLKNTTDGADSSHVIAFGGSYGGMLAAWFRMKYPNIVTGSLASSAPIWSFISSADCNGFLRRLTETFQSESPKCVQRIRKLWSAVDDVANKTNGLTQISDTFHLCKPLQNQTEVQHLKDWMNGAMQYLGMIDYPYPANFIQPLSAWPVKEFCKPFSTASLDSDDELLIAAYDAMNYYVNYTGNRECLDIGSVATDDLDASGWDYQTCTEMVMPFCSDGKQDMFEPSSWNFTQSSDYCFEKYGVRPDPNWLDTQFWGRNIDAASNIIFSNGLLDPWSSGGVMDSLSASVIAIQIPKGAHHLDLRFANPDDPQDVKAARVQIKSIFRRWLQGRNIVPHPVLQTTTVINTASTFYNPSLLITGIVCLGLFM